MAEYGAINLAPAAAFHASGAAVAGRKTLVLALACIAGAVLLTTYTGGQGVELAQAGFVAPANVMHGHALAMKAMPLPMDKEIAEDIALLRAQQQIVSDAESKLATAYGNKPLAPRGAARMQAAQFQGVPEGRNAPTGQLMMPPSEDDPTGDPRPAAKPFVEGESPERGYEVARFASENGPRDLAEVDGEQVADWNDFFNNMNARVDAPRWGKENMVIDNLDDIEPCRVDCDKDGGSTGEDFGFFGNMLALNERGHIIDNLDDIDACSIDC